MRTFGSRRWRPLLQARAVLSEMGIELSERQMRHAAETGGSGCRKLPFFRDPINGKLRIERGRATLPAVGNRAGSFRLGHLVTGPDTGNPDLSNVAWERCVSKAHAEAKIFGTP